MNLKVLKIDRLAWLDASVLSDTEMNLLKDRLTLFTEDIVSHEMVKTTLYETVGTFIGIPRQFVKRGGFDLSSALDCTTFGPAIAWPEFRGTLRDGQIDGVHAYLMNLMEDGFGGILQAKCGAGKTATALYMMGQIGMPSLVLVHKSDLIDQWAEAIKKFYGLERHQIGWIRTDEQRFVGYPVTLALYQSVRARQAQLEAKGFFRHFSVLAIDEAHRAPAKTFEETVRLFPAKLRIGLTATPRRADGLERIFGWHIGDILARMAGETVTGDFKQIGFCDKSLKTRCGDNMAKAITLLSEDCARNRVLVQWIMEASSRDRNVLVLTDRIEHVNLLIESIRMKQMEASGYSSVAAYIGGMAKVDLDQSKKAKVIVGSYGMLSEGTDIPDRDTLFLATPRGDIEQVVGRIQRVHKDKKPIVVLDVVDTGMGLFIGLAKKRRKIMLTLGFTELK